MQTPPIKQIIFTSSPEFYQTALNEIQKLDRSAKLLQKLDDGVGFVQLETQNFSDLSAQILDTKAVFIRHLFPVMNQIEFCSASADFSKLQNQIDQYCSSLDFNKTVSIQIRLAGNSPRSYSRSDLYQFLAAFLVQKGLKVEAKKPAQIISIFCTDHSAYVGVSDAQQNLSDWAGGMHRFAHEKEQISRAEFKLLEAIDVFNLALPDHGQALDLGASPGGWIRVLRRFGLSVVAVDPGDLSEKLRLDQHVTHHRQLVQKFLPTCQDRFDLIVNDMRMNAIESAKIMLAASDILKENGLAIMTLKLPSKGVQRVIQSAIDILKQKYEILGARNLFHNRQEATLALRLKVTRE